MAKVELFNPSSAPIAARRRRVSRCGAARPTSRRSRRRCGSAGRATSSRCSRRGRGSEGAAQEVRAPAAHRRRRGSRSPPACRSSRRDQGHRPAARGSRKLRGRLRRAGRRRRPARAAAARRLAGRHRPADGADLRALRGAVTDAPLLADRRRLARPPRLPRAAEVDAARRRPARGRARRLRQLPAPALAGRAAARGGRRLGHARGADLPARGASPPTRAGRVFDDALLEQLDLLPELVEAMRLRAPRRRPATRRTTSSPPRSRSEEARGGTTLVATSDRDAFQLVSERDDDPPAGEGRERARADRPGRGARALRRRAGAGAGLHRAARRPVRQAPGRARASARRRPPSCSPSTARSRRRSPPAGSRREAEDLRLYRRIATMDASAPLPSLADQTPNVGGGVLSRGVVGPGQPRRPARGARG